MVQNPNDAHIALTEYNIPVITMNIDGLHQLAGTDALELHGGLPEDDEMDIAYSLYNKPVLYGDHCTKLSKSLCNGIWITARRCFAGDWMFVSHRDCC